MLMIQLQSHMLNVHEGSHRLMTSTNVDDWQLLDEETVENVSNLVMTDRRLSVGFVAASVDISTFRVHLIFMEFVDE